MTSPRYIARFDSKHWVIDRFEELYVVIDTKGNEALSAPKSYHDANDEADARNNGSFSLECIIDWLPGNHITP